MTALEYRAYHAWDASTRWFHWINALAVIGLIATGLAVLNDDALGLSAGGKILVKSIHVSIGYAMGANLLWRFIWAFFGNRYTRWRGILPGGSGYLASLRAYIVSFLSGEPQQYVGHNSVARIGIAVLLLLLRVQVATGLVIAGTDRSGRPLGTGLPWVAAPGVDPTAIEPGKTGLIDKATYQAMRAFRLPFVTVHEIAFYALMVLIGLHIVAVVITELHEGGNITSAMFTGTKVHTRRPPDAPSTG